MAVVIREYKQPKLCHPLIGIPRRAGTLSELRMTQLAQVVPLEMAYRLLIEVGAPLIEGLANGATP
jgi:hypothetical protein